MAKDAKKNDATAEAFESLTRAIRALAMLHVRLTPSVLTEEAQVYVEARLREVQTAITAEER
jgi:hypothetical protein